MLYKFKLDHSATQVIQNSNPEFRQYASNESTVQCWFNSSMKEMIVSRMKLVED